MTARIFTSILCANIVTATAFCTRAAIFCLHDAFCLSHGRTIYCYSKWFSNHVTV
jgi:hypothetical protein